MEEFEEYLDAFLKNKDMSREAAEQLCTVKHIKEYYLEKERQQRNILRGDHESKELSETGSAL